MWGREPFKKGSLPHAPTRENFDWWGGYTKGVPLHRKKNPPAYPVVLHMRL